MSCSRRRSGRSETLAVLPAYRESRGRVMAEVLGGLGDDDLTLAVSAPEGVSLTALVDGGDGFDICRRTRNVRSINCEREEILDR